MKGDTHLFLGGSGFNISSLSRLAYVSQCSPWRSPSTLILLIFLLRFSFSFFNVCGSTKGDFFKSWFSIYTERQRVKNFLGSQEELAGPHCVMLSWLRQCLLIKTWCLSGSRSTSCVFLAPPQTRLMENSGAEATESACQHALWLFLYTLNPRKHLSEDRGSPEQPMGQVVQRRAIGCSRGHCGTVDFTILDNVYGHMEQVSNLRPSHIKKSQFRQIYYIKIEGQAVKQRGKMQETLGELSRFNKVLSIEMINWILFLRGLFI